MQLSCSSDYNCMRHTVGCIEHDCIYYIGHACVYIASFTNFYKAYIYPLFTRGCTTCPHAIANTLQISAIFSQTNLYWPMVSERLLTIKSFQKLLANACETIREHASFIASFIAIV